MTQQISTKPTYDEWLEKLDSVFFEETQASIFELPETNESLLALYNLEVSKGNYSLASTKLIQKYFPT